MTVVTVVMGAVVVVTFVMIVRINRHSSLGCIWWVREYA
jgi:hypothetical protein